MSRYATLEDLLLRASADDLARAASRDQPAPVSGELLRRAAAEPQPLDEAALDRLRGESAETIYAASKATADFTADDFTSSSTTGSVVPPAYAARSYLAVAVPAALRVTSILVGAFDQFGAFERAGDVAIDGVDCAVWRTTAPWSARSSGTAIGPRPLEGGRARWDAASVAALPATLARIDAALDDADAEIEGRIGPRYPAAVPTRTLESKACDLALYAVVGGDRDSEEARRWEAAIRYLRDLAAGAIDLESPEPPSDDAPASLAPTPVFSGRPMQDYVAWR